MLLFITVTFAILFELSLIYRPNWILGRTADNPSNCIYEKWNLLADATRDRVFNVNYQYHVDGTEPETVLLAVNKG